MSSVYLSLLIFLLATLIPACVSSCLAFYMMYSAYKLNKCGNNMQPWCIPFHIWNQSFVLCPVLTVASWPAYRFLKRQCYLSFKKIHKLFLFATPEMAAHQAPPIPGILQARTLEWVAVSFSNAWKWKVKWSHSVASDWATPWTAAYQAPPSVGFSRQEYWSEVPLPSPTHMYTCVQIHLHILSAGMAPGNWVMKVKNNIITLQIVW